MSTARCDSCQSEVQFQAWVNEDGKLIQFQDGAENWCPGCECHKVSYTVVDNQQPAPAANRTYPVRGTVPGASCGTDGCANRARWIPVSEGNAGSRIYRCQDCCNRIANAHTGWRARTAEDYRDDSIERQELLAADYSLYDVWDHLTGLSWFIRRAHDAGDSYEVYRLGQFVEDLADKLRAALPRTNGTAQQ